jgi:hypothetical protein
MADGQMNPSERALRARLAAPAMHGRRDPRQRTAKAWAAFLASFERQADADGQLPAGERQRRAQQLRSAYFAPPYVRLGRGPPRRRAAKGGEASR